MTELFKVAMIARDRETMPGWALKILDETPGLSVEYLTCNTEEDLLSIASDADMIWTMAANKVLTPEVLHKMPKCKAIFRSGSGMDCYPVEEASKLGIHMLNSPESISECVAEHAVSLLFALIRQIPFCDSCMRGDNSRPPVFHWHISGRTIGLVGFGRIGRRVTEMMAGFRMKVLVFDPFTNPDAIRAAGAEPSSLEDLLARSDYVSLHCPLTEQTRNLMDARHFAMMKKNALLVNTSRGGVVDQEALCDALEAGTIGGAALDVTVPEPPLPDSRLFRQKNLIMTPHIAASSADFIQNFYECSIKVILECLNGDFNSHCMNRAELKQYKKETQI